MALTRPTGEQLRFVSSKSGEHILDTYLEACELGDRTIYALLEDIFDSSGNLIVAGLYNWQGTWQTATPYNVGDVFADPSNNDVYATNENHTSTSIAADTASGHISKVIDMAAVRAAAVASIGSSYLLTANNLSEITDAAAARSNIDAAQTSHNHDGTYEPADADILKADTDDTIEAQFDQTPVALGSLDAFTDDTVALADLAGSNRFTLTADVDGEIDVTGIAAGLGLSIKVTNSGTRSLTITGATPTANSGAWDTADGAVNILAFDSTDLIIDQRGA